MSINSQKSVSEVICERVVCLSVCLSVLTHLWFFFCVCVCVGRRGSRVRAGRARRARGLEGLEARRLEGLEG